MSGAPLTFGTGGKPTVGAAVVPIDLGVDAVAGAGVGGAPGDDAVLMGALAHPAAKISVGKIALMEISGSRARS
ncbi:MAG: hypothetical protein ABJC26_18255 [Gemmatimonadaceae bacterium]